VKLSDSLEILQYHGGEFVCSKVLQKLSEAFRDGCGFSW